MILRMVLKEGDLALEQGTIPTTNLEDSYDPTENYDPVPSKEKPPYFTQAGRVLHLFGGAYNLAKALKAVGVSRTPCGMYRWTYRKDEGGTGGLVPCSAWHDILKAAKRLGMEKKVKDELVKL